MLYQVVWFNKKRGFGFITEVDGNGKEIYIHRSQVPKGTLLTRGALIELENLHTEWDII